MALRSVARSALRSPDVVYPTVLVLGLALLAAGWLALGGAAAEDGVSSRRHVEGVMGAPARVNPLLGGANQPDDDVAALVFSGLTRIAADGTPLPDLAERWEVTPDGRTYTFHLRRDVFWHDGERLSTADVAFTIGLVQSPDFAGSEALAAAWAPVEVIVADERTLLLRLPEPSAPFLTVASLGVLPRHLLDGVEGRALLDAPFNRAPVGTGPYRLVELERTRARLERNTSYHLGAPEIEEIELRFYPDAGTLADALARSDIDGALLPAGAAPPANPDLRALARTEAGYLALYLNNQRAPLDGPALRQALGAAVDRTTAAALLGGVAGDGPVVPGSWAYQAGSGPTLGDPAELLDAAGWTRNALGRRGRDGVELQLELATNDDPQRLAVAELIAERLRALGVRVTLAALPASELLATRVEPRDYDLLLFGWEQGPDPDPYPAWHTSQVAPGGQNVAGYIDPTADALLESARATLDVAERRGLYVAFADRFADTVPSLIVLYPRRTYLVPITLEGVDAGLLFGPESRFRDIHLWTYAR